MENEALVVATGDQEVGFEADSSDVEEVQHELELLKADTIYHDFLADVALDRKIPDDPSDADFVVDGSGDAPSAGKVDLKDLEVEADSSSSSSDESDGDEVAEDVEVKVPPTSLKEAARYPPYWKVKDQIHLDTSTDYKSNEDPDYIPDQSDCQKCTSASGPLKMDPASARGDPKPPQRQVCGHEVANLVEMVEDLAVAPNEASDAEEKRPRKGSKLPSFISF